MSGRPRTALVVALAVVLAGCGALPVGGPEPATPSATAGPRFPAGASAAGVDAAALLDGHAAALDGTDHRYRLRRSVDRDRASVVVNRTVHVGTVDGERRVLVRATGPTFPRAPVERWETATLTVERPLDERGWTYGVTYGDVVDPPVAGVRTVLTPALADVEWAYTGATADGLLAYEATFATAGNVSDPDGRLLVAPDGTVRSLRATYRRDRPDGTTTTVTVRYDLDRSVGPPAGPDWLAEVPRVRLERAGDDAVAVVNTGEVTVPAGTALAVAIRSDRTGNPTLRAGLQNDSLALPEALAPGERAYVSVVNGSAGPRLRVTADRPTGPLVTVSSGVVSLRRVGTVRFGVVLPPANASAAGRAGG